MRLIAVWCGKLGWLAVAAAAAARCCKHGGRRTGDKTAASRHALSPHTHLPDTPENNAGQTDPAVDALLSPAQTAAAPAGEAAPAYFEALRSRVAAADAAGAHASVLAAGIRCLCGFVQHNVTG